MKLSDTENPFRDKLRAIIKAAKTPLSLRQLAEASKAKSLSQVGYHASVLVEDGYLRRFDQEAQIFYEATAKT